MVLTIFSLKISITKQKIPLEKAIQNELADKNFKESRRKAEVTNRIRLY